MTKFDCDNYDYECINCDEVFYEGHQEEMAEHRDKHQKYFKDTGKNINVGFWHTSKRIPNF